MSNFYASDSIYTYASLTASPEAFQKITLTLIFDPRHLTWMNQIRSTNPKSIELIKSASFKNAQILSVENTKGEKKIYQKKDSQIEPEKIPMPAAWSNVKYDIPTDELIAWAENLADPLPAWKLLARALSMSQSKEYYFLLADEVKAFLMNAKLNPPEIPVYNPEYLLSLLKIFTTAPIHSYFFELLDAVESSPGAELKPDPLNNYLSSLKKWFNRVKTTFTALTLFSFVNG